MSTTVYIVRHGIAEERAASGEDADRRLTDEGRRKVIEIARGLKEAGLKPDVILSSPLPRALETAKLIASGIDREKHVRTLPALSTDYDAEAVIAALEEFDGAGELMLVGHQPQLGEIASFLLTGSPSIVPLPFKKGGIAAIQVGGLPPQRSGELLWFMAPKQLRNLA